MNNKEEINQLVQTLWDYHLLHHKLKKTDCILVLGSNDFRIAEYGTQLFLDDWAPYIIFSGNTGELTKHWDEPEAEKFAKVALKKGVPEDKLYVENKSRNTGENIDFTKRLLRKINIDAQRIILVQKPYMERRAYATAKKRWPEIEWIIASPPIPFSMYPTPDIPYDLVVSLVVGDLQKIKVYYEKGFQIYQKIPDNVWDAYKKLVELGFTSKLAT
ncbi:MAG: YdcF family protein [Patescibacteria group bacterium]|jgi:uncharacterized SAM-binding protein YcdF (DUF218 family)